jgi:hypothetical protein
MQKKASITKRTKKNANKKRVTRKDKREILDEFNFTVELKKIINQFFPSLIPSLRNVSDPRNKSYIKYGTETILLIRILASIFQISSMRGLTDTFNTQITIDNVSITIKSDLEELPHYDTINNFLSRLDPKELENIIKELIVRLIRMRSFETSRIFNKFWQILIDGSDICFFDEKHCEHCLTQTHNRGEQNEYTIYYHKVLEAKLVLYNEIVISIASEFIENESPEVAKQDCETKAFYRLAERLKAMYPRLPICITVDSLYAQQNVFNICKANNWEYIIRFKSGSIPSVAEEFEALKKFNPDIKDESDENQKYVGVNGIFYENHLINVIEYIETKEKKNDNGEMVKKTTKYVFITSFKLTEKNYKEIVFHGRIRWKIENEGFNEQKNHGYHLEHAFSTNYTAMKNHYYLIQIAHMIAQIYEKSSVINRKMKLPTAQLFEKLKMHFLQIRLTLEDIKLSNKRFRARFV